MIQPPKPYTLRSMQLADIPQVMAIEEAVFPTPWPKEAYVFELTKNPVSCCLVVEANGILVGYGCESLVVDELHISNIAVDPPWRGKGLGELLLLAMIAEGIRQEGNLATLEVRVSNHVAQSLYQKYGFLVVGKRKRYYQDNREDALIMNASPFDNKYRANLVLLQKALWKKLESPGSA